MKVLILGEKSQEICMAFRRKGYEAFSCDLQECEGGYPEFHLKMDMFEAYDLIKPDLSIWHPVCTYMCNSGALRLYVGGKKENGIDMVRWGKMEAAAHQFKRILAYPGPLAVENPVMHKWAKEIIGSRQSQTIQPYEYGHPESKRTCLWLKGLPLLKPTNILPLPESGHWENQTASGQNKLPPSEHRASIRAKTYTGWAEAMADQWGLAQRTKRTSE